MTKGEGVEMTKVWVFVHALIERNVYEARIGVHQASIVSTLRTTPYETAIFAVTALRLPEKECRLDIAPTAVLRPRFSEPSVVNYYKVTTVRMKLYYNTANSAFVSLPGL